MGAVTVSAGGETARPMPRQTAKLLTCVTEFVENSHHPKLRMTPGRDTAPGFFVRPRQHGGDRRAGIVFIVPALFFIVIADPA